MSLPEGSSLEPEHLVALIVLPRGVRLVAVALGRVRSSADHELALDWPAWAPLDRLDARSVDGDADRVL